MSFLDKVKRAAEAGMKMAADNLGGSATLRDAYLGKKAPQKSGVYRVYYRGQLMKVGKAPNGLRKRFSDYYRGLEGGTAGLKYITFENCDDVIVQWILCPATRAREIETRLYDEAKAKGETLPWSERR